jgi:butyryl-CoA dehydrogenase
MEKILSRRDVDFLLYEWLEVEALTGRPRYAEHSRETFDAALDAAEKIATDLFAPHARKADLNEPRFDGERVELIPEIEVLGDWGELPDFLKPKPSAKAVNQ